MYKSSPVLPLALFNYSTLVLGTRWRYLYNQAAEQILSSTDPVFVVGEGFIALDGGELRVVRKVDTLVTIVLSDFVNLVHTTNYKLLKGVRSTSIMLTTFKYNSGATLMNKFTPKSL